MKQHNRITSFFSHFDQKVKTTTIEVCKAISQSEANLYILMARKAACFFECLHEMDLVQFNGTVASDRILEMDCSWLKNKKVIIIDDAVISGTTIYETIEKLRKIGVKEIEVFVLCINKKWCRLDMLSNREGIPYIRNPFLKLEDEECIKMCTDIVYALSKYIRPYSVDFPLYKNILISEGQLKKIILTSEWVVDDISTKNQTQDKLIVLTFTPSPLINELLDQKLGLYFSKVSMPKVRLYLANEAGSYRLCILPVVVLKPIYEEDIIEIFEHFAEHKSDTFRKQFISTVSKIHFIQYVTAGVIGLIWAKSFEESLPYKEPFKPDAFNNSLLFNPYISQLVYNSVLHHYGTDEKETIFASIKVIKNMVDEKLTAKEKRFDNLIGCQAALTQPFLDLYYNEEVKSRKYVLEYGKAVYQKEEFIETVHRLKRGYSVNSLLNTISAIQLEGSDGQPFPFNHMKFLSLFLDKSIDLGIVVPIVSYNEVCHKKYYYRAYRHGEDVSFGEVEFLLCTYLLDHFIKLARESGSVSHLTAEKLIVLFIKIGIAKEVFVQFISNLSNTNTMQNEGIVSIRNYLFGQVATMCSFDRFQQEKIPVYLNDEGHSSWITQKLLDRNLLIIEKGKDNYRIGESDYLRLDQKKRDQTLIIADLFGMLMRKDISKLKENDLVVLTSCIEPHDIAGSLAAELVIFNNRWPDYQFYFDQNKNAPNRYFLIATNIRRKFSMLLTAIDSGQKKFLSYKSKAGIQLVNDISNYLDTQRAIDAATWRSFWSPNLEGTGSDSPLESLVDTLGVWLLRTNLLIRVLEYVARAVAQFEGLIHDKNRDFLSSLLTTAAAERSMREGDSVLIKELTSLNERNKKDLSKSIKYFQEQLLRFDPDTSFRYEYFSFLKTDFSSLQFNQLRTVVADTFDNLKEQFYYSKIFIEDVDSQVTSYGKPAFRVDFTQALYLDTHGWDETKKTKQMSRLVSLIQSMIKEIMPLRGIKDRDVVYKVMDGEKVNRQAGIFVLFGGDDCEKISVLLSVKVYNVFSKKNNGFGILFKNLQREYAPMHTGLESGNIWYRYFKEFTGSFITQLSQLRSIPPFTIIAEKNSIGAPMRRVARELAENELYYFTANKANRLFTEMPFPHEVDAASFSRKKKDATASAPKSKKIKVLMPNLFSDDPLYDIGIITIRETETKIVHAALDNFSDKVPAPSKKKYYSGTAAGENGFIHRIIQTQMPEMGNIHSGNMYQLMMEDFNPKLIIIFGTAGGYADKSQLCDVILSKKVIYYEVGKEKSDRVHREAKIFRINPHFEDHFINDFFKNNGGDDIKLQATQGSLSDQFTVYKGTIGAGEKILEDPDSDVRAWLRATDRKTFAFEMESAGAFAAVEHNEVYYGRKNFGVITVRAIADHGDVTKTMSDIEKYREPALANAMVFVRKFLLSLPDLQKTFQGFYPM